MKTVVITGGTKGIGKSLVIKYLSKGFTVITCARDVLEFNKLEIEADKLLVKSKLFTYQCDFADKVSVENFCQFVITINDHIDILINNVGNYIYSNYFEESEGQLEEMLQVNLIAHYNLTRRLVEKMKAGSVIVNMCSIASIKPMPQCIAYTVSKFAFYGFTKALRETMKEQGIKVCAILPGATMTDSWKDFNGNTERLMKASDIANIIYSTAKTGSNYVVEELIIRPQLGDL